MDTASDMLTGFDLAGNRVTLVVPAVGKLDNSYGGTFANNTIYVTNDGGANGGNTETVVYFDTSGNRLGEFDVSNSGIAPRDIVEFNGELLVTHRTSANDIGRYDYAGNLLGVFYSSPGITALDLPAQISVTSSNTVLVHGAGVPWGVYEFDATGTQINYWPTSFLFNRGVHEMGNGSIMITDSTGVYALDRGTGAITPILTGVACEHIGALEIPGPALFCKSRPSSLPNCTPLLQGADTTVSKTGGAGSFDITAGPVPGGGGRPGILIYTKNGLLASPSTTPFGDLCLNLFLRAGAFFAAPGGTNGQCNGAYLWDFGNIASVTGQIAAGDTLYVQAWYRDPPNTGTANFTQGIGPIDVLP